MSEEEMVYDFDSIKWNFKIELYPNPIPSYIKNRAVHNES